MYNHNFHVHSGGQRSYCRSITPQAIHQRTRHLPSHPPPHLRHTLNTCALNPFNRLIINKVNSILRHRPLQHSQPYKTLTRQRNRLLSRPINQTLTRTSLCTTTSRQTRRITDRNINSSNRTRRIKFNNQHTMSLPRTISSRQPNKSPPPVYNFSLTGHNATQVKNNRQTRVVRSSNRHNNLIRHNSIRINIRIRRRTTRAQISFTNAINRTVRMDTFRYKRPHIRSTQHSHRIVSNSIYKRRTLRAILRHCNQQRTRIPSTTTRHFLTSIRVTSLVQNIRTHINTTNSNRTRQLNKVISQRTHGHIRRPFSLTLRNTGHQLLHPSRRTTTIVYRIGTRSRRTRRCVSTTPDPLPRLTAPVYQCAIHGYQVWQWALFVLRRDHGRYNSTLAGRREFQRWRGRRWPRAR